MYHRYQYTGTIICEYQGWRRVALVRAYYLERFSSPLLGKTGENLRGQTRGFKDLA